jgi:hypothetical protein
LLISLAPFSAATGEKNPRAALLRQSLGSAQCVFSIVVMVEPALAERRKTFRINSKARLAKSITTFSANQAKAKPEAKAQNQNLFDMKSFVSARAAGLK